MRNRFSILPQRLVANFVAFAIALLAPSVANGQTLDVVHNFGVISGDGNEPYSGLIEDADGNFYGTTFVGGTSGFGTVYRLSPTKTGEYQEAVLYSFKGGSADGSGPHATLFRDSAGNLYGTTVTGGITSAVCNEGSLASPVGCGVVFELKPTATGEWTETDLHRFTGIDGGNPFSGLVRDAAGNFYGTTLVGGSHGLGTVYKLSRTSTGWKETVLHSFAGNTDGAEPFVNCNTLVFDRLGNLYGSTYKGGAANAGVVFVLMPQSSGTWTEKILYTFKGGVDGNEAFTGVILDKSGNIYGTTSLGGTHNSGTVFKLTAATGYSKTILHNFSISSDSAKGFPNALMFDASGDLIGTTAYAAFKLIHGTTGWTETVLWTWDDSQDQNGNTLFAPLMMDAQGNLWGVTLWGGQAGSTTGGVAFKLVP